MMVQSEAIFLDEEPGRVIETIESSSVRLALESDDHPGIRLGSENGSAVRALLRLIYVPLDSAAGLLLAAPPAVQKLVRKGVLPALEHDGQLYVSLLSVLEHRREQRDRRHEALVHMIRVSEEGGLYDAELEGS